MKKFLLWLHKWLGLFTGIIVVVVSLTGCIYVFHDDLKK
ncbi:PepSY-associated TM helix domain-containing protein [Myroides sp. mNGS23_01]|nr:PepSY-associated TM helix domain-containing protein [Myroides sp. mNGS23_01]WHT39223.1 PepSY-associated TM helix domain-containing protein [Myroides sp. mNGS23_01]